MSDAFDGYVEDVGQAEMYYHAQVQGYKALIKKRPDVKVDIRKFGAVFDGRNINDAFMRAHDEVVSQGGGWLMLAQGQGLIHDLPAHPMVNIEGPGIGNCQLTIAAGAISAGIRCLARGQPIGPTLSTFSWRPIYRGFLINGNKSNQVNVVDGILYENWNLDPQFGQFDTTNYSSGYLDDIYVYRASGIGINSSPGRHRLFAVATKATDCNGNGIKLGGDDSILGIRCGFGANGAAAVLASAISGFMMRGVNVWSPSGSNRSDTDQAVLISSCNGASIIGCVLNDSIRVRSNTKTDDRAVVIVGNDFRPDNSTLVANGVPAGTFTDYSNAWIIVDNSEQVSIGLNGYSAQSQSRWGFKNLISAVNTARVSAQVTASSDSTNCPWADPTNKVPFYVDNIVQASIDLDFVDTFTRTRRIGTPITLLGFDAQELPVAGYGTQFGNSLPGGQYLPTMMKPDMKFLRGEAWDWGAGNMAQRLSCTQHGVNNFQVSTTRRHAEIFCVGGLIDAVTIQLGLTGSTTIPTSGKVIRIRFAQAVTAITWVIQDPTAGATPPISRETLPAAATVGMVVELSWDDSGVGGTVYAWNRIL